MDGKRDAAPTVRQAGPARIGRASRSERSGRGPAFVSLPAGRRSSAGPPQKIATASNVKLLVQVLLDAHPNHQWRSRKRRKGGAN
jgi:hypothetical protein